MSLLISLIIWLVLIGLVWWLLQMLPLPAPIMQIINVVIIIFLILVILSVFGITGVDLPKMSL